MIDKIYEVIADKTISFGCNYFDRDGNLCTYYPLTRIYKDTNDLWNFYWHYYISEDWKNVWYIKIIWHPVMIWDVLDWIYSDKYEHNKEKCKIHDFKWEYEDFFWWLWVEVMILAERRWHKRKPIEDQSEECIEFVYNLIK